jgi:hypothetical protein
LRALLVTTALVVVLPAGAQALTVYPGCAVPTVKASHHTFYVDPVNGSMKGDGSAAKPWHTLAEVVNPTYKLIATQSHKVAGGTDALQDVNPKAPIQPGDLIMLKTGNHGDVSITNNFNKDFIGVLPAPGQAPVIQSLRLTSSGKWAFQGLKFMPGVGTKRPGGIIAVGYGDWVGQTHDVLLDSNTISTADNTANWSNADWMNNTQTYAIAFTLNVPCGTATNNHIYGVLNGIAAASTNSVIQGNLIEKIFNDGVDIGTSNVIVKNNSIKGGVNDVSTDTLHADGIQGFVTKVNGQVQTNRNVVIDGNQIYKTGNADITYMQGITIFDGKWDNLTIQNNVIATNHWNALVAYGAQNSKIVNNTVIATDPAKHPSWIQIRNAKDGTVPSNTIIRNNISTQLSVVGNSMQVDHNIAAQSISVPGLAKPITSGTTGTQNKVVTNISSQFVTFNIPANSFDMRLKSGSSAIGFGSPTAMPTVDIVGKSRSAPVDLGAYAH